MGKAASKKNIARAQDAHEESPDAIGPRLGVMIYRSKVPAMAVAQLLRTSLPTLYRWIYGVNDVTSEFRKRVIRLTAMLEEALDDGRLPATGTLDQRIQTLIRIVQAGIAPTKD